MVDVSAGSDHIVGLKADGTVVAIGDNTYGQCDVSTWKDIVAVSAGAYHTVGLKADGTVISTRLLKNTSTFPYYKINYDQTFVGSWRDIVAISAGTYHTVGLKSDGTVVGTGRDRFDCLKINNWHLLVP